MKYIGDRVFYKNASKIALPIIVQNAFTFAVNFVDNIMVGQIGKEAVSGVAIVNQLLFVFNICILGIIAGASIFGAQFAGKNDIDGLRETFRFRFTACILLTVVGFIVFGLFDKNLIALFLHSANNDSEIQTTLTFGRSYLRILLISLVPSALTQIYASTQKDKGETFIPMCASVTAVIMNTLLNYILIFGKFGFPALGVEGAAIATVIARVVECLIIVCSTHSKKGTYPFIVGAFRSWKISSALAKKIMVKGSPLMINEVIWSTGMVTVVQCYSVRGIDVVAGINIAKTIYDVFSVLYIAIGGSIAIIIGQLLGADKMKEARDADNKLIFLAVASSLIIGAIILISAPFYPKIYNVGGEVQRLSTQFMYVLALGMPIAAYIHAAFFTIRAGGNTLITLLFDSSTLWLINVPLAICLTRFTNMHIVLIYFICQMADIIKCIVGFILVKKGIWLNNIVSNETPV